MKLLAGKVAIVTGAARGIGRAIALDFAENGATVVVNYRNSAESAQAIVQTIMELGGQAVAVQADVADAKAANDLIQTTLEQFGQIDILVNNAGTTRDGLLMRMSDEAWDTVLDTNLKGVFHCSRAALRPMVKRRNGGRIINISSIVGLNGAAGQANYAASKAGIHGFTKSLAKEIGSRGITVNAVAPGFFITDLTANVADSVLERVQEFAPLRRPGTLEELAWVVTFLASDRSAYITGEVIRVDGGLGIGL